MALQKTILKKLLNIKGFHIENSYIENYEVEKYKETHTLKRIVLHGRPYKSQQCRCPICHKKCVCNGHRMEGESTWRASSLNGIPVFIKYRPQRIYCEEHGALNEYIPWADGDSRFTTDFNNEIAWLVCQLSKTAIAEYKGINWRTVGQCVKAAHNRLEPDITDRLHDNVRRICVDETSYKRGHKYITVVYDIDKNRVIWVHENHGREVFEEFCNMLTSEERDNIEIVAGDGAKWIDSCCKDYFPNAVRCIDFFHVVQWITEALDKVRKSTVNKARREYDILKAEFKEAEKEAEKTYTDAVKELGDMPKRGRPSNRKKELITFIQEYEKTRDAETELPRPVGRPKKEKFSQEHEKSLNKLSDILNDLKASKYALGHNPENCNDNQIAKLELIENSYPDLYRAYQIKESLRLILHMKDPVQAACELTKWKEDVRQSKLKPMINLADKIERHEINILNSIKHQANSAKSESTNTTIKVLIRMARGFRRIDTMISLIYLKCSDIIVPLPNIPQPTAEYLAQQREHANYMRNLREERKRLEIAG